MRGQALLSTVPLAAGALAVLELTRLPGQHHRGDVGRLAAALTEIVRSAGRQLAVPAALLLLAAAMVLLFERFRAEGAEKSRRGRAVLVGLWLLGGLQALLAQQVLAEDPPFAWNPLALGGFVVLGALIGLAHAWLASPPAARHRRWVLGLAAAVTLASLVLARAHYGVLVGQYPTLHACVVRVAFLGVALGLAFALAAAERPRVSRRIAVIAVAALALVAVLELPAAAWARSSVVVYTELGREASVRDALDRHRASLLPDALPPPRTHPVVRPDRNAVSRFRAHSGLPPLSIDLVDHDVLLVLSEATRFRSTSLADGASVAATPSLTRLAERSQSFRRAYAPSNGTFASVASVLSMAPVSFAELDVRPRFWRGRLREERTTAVEAMRAAGRATFWIGHDHRGCFSNTIQGLDQGFEERVLIPQERLEPADADADARIADAAIDAIRRHRRAGERYFGLVFFVSPHDDYQVHDPGAPHDTAEARYAQELAFMDAQLGRLLDALEADGALDDTVVVFTGDHGEAFGEHGHHHHLTSLHDEQIHVPLVVHVPGLSPATHAAPTSTGYVFPWLLLRGAPGERAEAERVLVADVGPMMRATDNAVLSEMIGPRRQEAALIWERSTVLYDVLADLVRVYDTSRDPGQQRDLREDDSALLDAVTPPSRRYRAARFFGRRFRFTP